MKPVFDGKIPAIKAIRQRRSWRTSDGTQAFVVAPMSLVEAKELVEAIMELGVREFLKEQMACRLLQARTAGGSGSV